METLVAWTYIAGFSFPLLGSIAVLIRSIGSLMSSGDPEIKPCLIKLKPFSTTLVVLVFTFLILLALLPVVFFIYKFAVPRYSFPLELDIAGIILFLLYISGSGSLVFSITGRFGRSSGRYAMLSGGLVDMVTEKIMGRASSRNGSLNDRRQG